MARIKRIIKRFQIGVDQTQNQSVQVNDEAVIEAFINNLANPFLISFPRTGSHWLRMIMELYFERPSLRRVFFYPNKDEYLTMHTHDLDLDVQRTNVIYLYRDPVNTVYSQLQYHKEPLDNETRICYWTDLYGKHLAKWLYMEDFTVKKTIVTYEGLLQNLETEFAKLTQHFDQPLDNNRLEQEAAKITKSRVKDKTQHDPQVVQLKETYNTARETFKKDYAGLIWDCLIKDRADLLNYFDDEVYRRG